MKFPLKSPLLLNNDVLNKILNLSSSPACLINSECGVVECNEAFENLVKREKKEIIGKTCCQLVHKRKTKRKECPFLLSEKSLATETRKIRIGKKIFEVLVEPIVVSNKLIGAVHLMRQEGSIGDDIIVKNASLQNILDYIPMGIVVYSPYKDGKDFIIKKINSAVEKIENLSRKDTAGKRFTKVFPKAYDCGLIAIIRRVWKSGKSEYYPALYYKTHRAEKWRESYFHRMPSGNVIMFYRDISAQKNMERNLKESEQKYRLIAENTNDIIFIQDNKFRMKYISPSVKNITGYSVDEAMKLPMRKMVTSESYKKLIKDFIKDVIVNKKITEMPLKQYEYIRKDGSTFWGELKLNPLLNKKGKIWGFQGILRDITERKKIEDELKKSKEFLNLIVENSPNSLWVADSKGTLIIQNEANRRLFGITDKQVVGKYNIFRDEELKKKNLMHLAENVFKKGETVKDFVLEYDFSKVKHINAKGCSGKKWLSVTMAPIKDPSGRVTNVIIQHRDITLQKKAEDELKQKAEELEKFSEFAVGRELAMIELKNHLNKLARKCGRAPEFKFKAKKNLKKRKYREAAMLNIVDDLVKLNRKLAEANRELKELDKAKSNFLNMVSHELKTPLTAIFAHLGVLEDETTEKKCFTSLNAIKRNSRQLKNLIDNILEIARMEAGKFELVMEEFEMKKLICDVINEISILSEKKGLEIRKEIKDLPTVYSDKLRVREILINLIGNAIKFTDKGFIKVSAKKDGNFIKVEIQDTGIGIPADKIKNLFKKFYQVDSSLSRKHGGTGLGLSISKQLAEALGGSIGVSSKVGKGSIFYFRIPISSYRGGAKNEKNTLCRRQ